MLQALVPYACSFPVPLLPVMPSSPELPAELPAAKVTMICNFLNKATGAWCKALRTVGYLKIELQLATHGAEGTHIKDRPDQLP